MRVCARIQPEHTTHEKGFCVQDFTYYSPTQIVFGKGVVDEVGAGLAEQGIKRVLIVFGKGSVIKNGTLNRVLISLDKAGIAHAQVGGVRPNPEVGLVRDAIEAARVNEIDCILAVGGGSAIDTAKAISLGVPYEGDVWDIYAKRATPVEAGKPAVACVLTIPAAGSEASDSSVITNDELCLKRGVSTPLNRPLVSFLDPELTYTLPAYQTAAGVTDMCSHIMERFFSSAGAVSVTDELCCGLLRSIMVEVPRALADPSCFEARANLMWASTLAHSGLAGCGRGNNCRGGGWECHALEHELSAHDARIAHGAGLAVVTPAWMRYAWRSAPERFLTLGRLVFGIEPACEQGEKPTKEATQQAVLATIDAVQAFFTSLGMPRTLGELGVTAQQIPALLETLRQNKGETIGDIMELTQDDCRAIYESAL